MAAAPSPFECTAKENVWFAVRKRHITGQLITNANTAGISVIITGDRGIGQTLSATGVGTIYDTLVTNDPRWPDNCNEDLTEKGYNFDYIAPVTAFPSSGYYRVEFKFTDTNGNVTKHTFNGPARSTSET